MREDDRLSPEQVQASMEAWRSGTSVDAAREAWRARGLPDETFQDIVERTQRLETWMSPGDALMRIAGLAVSVTRAVVEESGPRPRKWCTRTPLQPRSS